MAEKRMFALSIIDSDLFLDMPMTSQALYFHLAMRADDDGFVDNPQKIKRSVCASDDDMKLLIAKQFIIPFESGVVVIKHWWLHNYLRSDRHKPTIYQDEKSQLTLDNNVYSFGIPTDNQLATTGIPSGNQLAAQIRVEKKRKEKNNTPLPPTGENGGEIQSQGEGLKVQTAGGSTRHPTTLDENFSLFWAAYPRKASKPQALKAWQKLKPDKNLIDRILQAIEVQKKSDQWQRDNGQYIPYPATWLNGRRWEDEIQPIGNGKDGKNETGYIRDNQGSENEKIGSKYATVL